MKYTPGGNRRHRYLSRVEEHTQRNSSEDHAEDECSPHSWKTLKI